jgi:hypothetical protein
VADGINRQPDIPQPVPHGSRSKDTPPPHRAVSLGNRRLFHDSD